MANTKDFYTRIQNKHDTEANWRKAINFIPLVGELIVYDSDTVDREIVIDEETIVIPACNYQRFKIGNGINKVTELPFYSDFLLADIEDAKKYAAELDKTLEAADNALKKRLDDLEARELFTNIITHKKISQDSNLLLSDIIETYILNIDYDSKIKFDTAEIVIGGATSDSTTAILGKAILGKMILG